MGVINGSEPTVAIVTVGGGDAASAAPEASGQITAGVIGVAGFLAVRIDFLTLKGQFSHRAIIPSSDLSAGRRPGGSAKITI